MRGNLVNVVFDSSVWEKKFWVGGFEKKNDGSVGLREPQIFFCGLSCSRTLLNGFTKIQSTKKSNHSGVTFIANKGN